ncbi:MAG: PEGA domain-containing protein [Deltaproteobacteria bacterium]|nr:PEGA domain-containing protein [Candidatus Zymogenaceae bacterium]
MKRFLVAVILVMFSVSILGCWGINTITIISEPTGSKLYVNGEYVGQTPRSVPQKWDSFGGDATAVKLTNDGYIPFERTILHKELNDMYWSGNFVRGSQFGYGNTFNFSFNLEPDPNYVKPETED